MGYLLYIESIAEYIDTHEIKDYRLCKIKYYSKITACKRRSISCVCYFFIYSYVTELFIILYQK